MDSENVVDPKRRWLSIAIAAGLTDVAIASSNIDHLWLDARVRFTNKRNQADWVQLEALTRPKLFDEKQLVKELLNKEEQAIIPIGYNRLHPPTSLQNCVGYISEILWHQPKFVAFANQFYRGVLWRWGKLIHKTSELSPSDIVVLVDRTGIAQHIALIDQIGNKNNNQSIIIHSKNEQESVFELSLSQLQKGFTTLQRPISNYDIKFYRLHSQGLQVTLSESFLIEEHHQTRFQPYRYL